VRTARIEPRALLVAMKFCGGAARNREAAARGNGQIIGHGEPLLSGDKRGYRNTGRNKVAKVDRKPLRHAVRSSKARSEIPNVQARTDSRPIGRCQVPNLGSFCRYPAQAPAGQEKTLSTICVTLPAAARASAWRSFARAAV
jgi:hypothetical protein